MYTGKLFPSRIIKTIGSSYTLLHPKQLLKVFPLTGGISVAHADEQPNQYCKVEYIPSYTIVVREFFPAHEAGQRIGIVLMLTIFGMAIGGWMSGWIFDQTGSYQIAFLNGILWNVFNLTILVWLFIRIRKGSAEFRDNL